MLEEFDLQGKVAIIAGGDRSLGEVSAIALAEAGADVIIGGRDVRIGEGIAEKVRALGRTAITIPMDVTNFREVQSLVRRTASDFGKIDILVNNTDVEFAKPLLEVTDEEWHRLIDINLTAVFFCSKAAGEYMIARKQGKIINIASGLAERGLANCTAYCATKGGVVQFTKALALEWAPYNVYVNAIGLGWFSDGTLSQGSEIGQVVRMIPLRRLGQPSELGALVVYLASAASEWITGQTFFVDGGILLRA